MQERLPRAIFFDVDGLLIVGREFNFSLRLAEEYGVPLELVQEFFLTDFKQCPLGRADVKEVLVPHLARWEWRGSVDDLLTFWFESESAVDTAVLEVVRKVRAQGVSCYLATRQEKYRFAYILNTLGFAREFDGAFSTCDIGYEKYQPEFFTTVLSKLALAPSETIFFDDSQKNVDAAKRLGMHAYFYENIESLRPIHSWIHHVPQS